MEGICECGCGGKTNKRGKKYFRFLNGHCNRGERHHRWSGEKVLLSTLDGVCECGCGEKPNLHVSQKKQNRFIHGHHTRGENNYRWGGDEISHNGYIMTRSKDNQRSHNGIVPEQILVVEGILGHSLPLPALVHHVDCDRSNNIPTNLVVCQDSAYHVFLHHRTTAKKECGHASWRKCLFCHNYDDPKNMVKDYRQVIHKACRKEKDHIRYMKKMKQSGEE